MHSLTNSMEHLTLQPASSSTSPQPSSGTHAGQPWTQPRYKLVKNVHRDDIHAIIHVSETLISGSKDGSIKQWTLEGAPKAILYAPRTINYEQWITALAKIDDDRWISGTRDGYVHLWNRMGECKNLQAFPQQHQTDNSFKCKKRNINRVNCLASFVGHTRLPFYFVGWPTQFTLHSFDRMERKNYTFTSPNDWVYAVQPIHSTALLVVTGCRLDLYKQNQQTRHWLLGEKLIVEDTNIKPRPYISSVTPLQYNVNHYGLALFDGSVRIYDLQNVKTTYLGQEHKNRVWTVVNIRPYCFASCADDGLIKLWDVRESAKSYRTIVDNATEKSRVSVLVSLRENQLVSGSCPDDVRRARDLAQLSFWDLRQ